MKKIKILLLLANVVIALLIFVTIYDDDEQKRGIESEIVEILSNLHFISISEPATDKYVKIVKKNEKWVLQEPFSWEAEKLVLSNFKTKFAHLNFKELYTIDQIEKRGEIVQDYGLDENSTILEIKAADGALQLIVGKETKDEQAVYAQIKRSSDEAQSIWKVSKDIVEITNAEPSHWGISAFVNRPLYSIDQFSVTFRTETNNTSETRFEKIDSEWKFTEPFHALANKEKVLFFLNSLISEKVEGFVQSPDTVLKQKLKKDWRVKISLDSMGTREEVFILGPSGNDKIYRAAQSSFSSTIFLISEEFVSKKLSDLSTELRERTIFDLDSETLQSIEIQKKENSLKLSKENGLWFAAERNATDLFKVESEKESVELFLRSLNQIRIKEFLAFTPDKEFLDENGFSNPGYTLEILKSDTSKQTILVSESIEDASLSKIYNSEQALICVVDENLAEILSTENLSFRLKTLLPENLVIEAYDLVELANQKVLHSSDQNSSKTDSGFFDSFKAEKFLSNKFDKEGTWVEGNWFPWKYKVSFKTSSTLVAMPEFYFSERKGATSWYCGSKDLGVTFNLPIGMIDQLSLLIAPEALPSP
jgi:hypothetical protein